MNGTDVPVFGSRLSLSTRDDSLKPCERTRARPHGGTQGVPRAQEVISYNMPRYTVGGDRLLYFAAWKQHYSIYAATEQVVVAFQDEFARYELDKGTIRFPLSEPCFSEIDCGHRQIPHERTRRARAGEGDHGQEPLA
jgi:uncharacterized protein YdhG (YjbR/CyaY superfamily)